jgi:CzcA family heavy metal efflux pump
VIRGIISSSLRFRLLVIGIAAGVMVAGVVQLRKAPVDVLPEFTPPYVEIQTEALGLSAEEVEQLVTVPLEADLLNGTKGVTVLRSQSVPGESSIVLVFEPGTDIFDARQLVQEQLTQAHANPNVSQPPQMLQPLSSQSRVMMIGLSPGKLSPIEASVLARWTIRPRLLGIDGVANVSIFGVRDRQLQVLVDPARLRDERVSLRQVISTAGNAQLVSPLSFLEASTPGTGGFIDTPNQRLQVRHILPIVTPEKLAQVPVEGTRGGNGEPRRLGDVTNVVAGHQPLVGDALVDGRPGLLLVVEKFPGANTRDVTERVEHALDELAPGLAGMTVEQSGFRPADYIDEATDNLAIAVVIGCALLALVLFALLRGLRTAAVCLASVVLALTAAALVLSFTEATFNALVFAGLAVAVGVVIDDAVIDAENIRRRIRARRRDAKDGSRAAVVAEAATEMRSPIGYATAIILLTALPVFFIQGTSGAFFEPLVRSYVVAVAVSMLVALTVTPALSLVLLPGAPGEGREPRLLGRARGRYTRLLSRVVQQPGRTFVVAGGVAAVGLAVIPLLHGPVIPSFKDRDLLVHLDGPPGTSHPEMSRIVARASRDLSAVPGVQKVGGHVGRAVTGDQVVDVNSSELWVKLDQDADYDTTKAAVERTINGYPGLTHSVLTYEKQRIGEVGAVDDRQAADVSAAATDLSVLGGTNSRPLRVRVYGEDLDVLNAQGARMKRLLSGVDGVVDPRVERLVQEPTIAIEVSLAAAQRYGVKPGDVRRQAATLLQGIQVGSLFEKQKVFDVVVRATPRARRSLTDVRRLLIETPGGGHVPLGRIADVRVRATPQVIERDASSRRIDVSAEVSGRPLGDVKDDVKQRLRQLRFPLEYHAQVIGDATGARATVTRLAGFGIAAAVGIFLVLQAAFRSWPLACAAFLALPLSIVGGELAQLVDGGTFSLGALFGLVGVFGIAARNCVVLIRQYHHLERHDHQAFGPRLVLRGAGLRLGPILTVALATAAALLPFVALGDRAGLEVVHPMAVAMLGGLVTSTLLSLFLMPTLYSRFGAGSESRAMEELDLLQRWADARPEPADAPPLEPVGGGGRAR